MRVLIPVLALAATLASCSAPTEQKPAPVAIATATAQERSFTSSNELSGTLVASRTVTVGANAAGRLSAVPVQVGDHVSAGQTIATIDASGYAAALAQASGARAAAVAGIAQAQAALAQAQARERLASATAARDAALYQTGDVSRQHYDETQSSLQTARAAVVQAQASIAAAQGAAAQSAGAVAAAAVPLQDSVIVAPFAGVITQKLADTGAVVNPGSPVVALEDDASLEAEVAVPESLAATLHPGSPVMLHVDAIDADVRGSVRAIIPSQNDALHTATLRTTVAPHAGLIRGMFARLRVDGNEERRVAVPWQAVVTRAGQAGVFTVDGDRVRFVPVDTGASEHGWIAVSGVRPGTRVAVTGLERLDDGTAVAMR
ncbi:MAG TPA: efflux RND transporter periplasmic adaptor subunit [Candidatus Aquilonibacter sp.]|nr:efflux RND transporter periplasmic adaptor subunit [Candidatus Aquilonibacter sp.]